MSRFGFTETEKDLIRKRDFRGLIEAGTNIYYLLKIGSVTGNGLYRMGAQMRGETLRGVPLDAQHLRRRLMGKNRRRHRAVARAIGRPGRGPQSHAGSGVEAAVRCLRSGARMAGEAQARRRHRGLQRPCAPTSASTSTRPSRSASPSATRSATKASARGRCREVPGDLDLSIHLSEALDLRARVRPDAVPGDRGRARLPRADEPLLPARRAERLAGARDPAAGERHPASAAHRAPLLPAGPGAARRRGVLSGRCQASSSWAPAACRTSCRASASAT